MEHGFIKLPRAIMRFEEMKDCDAMGTYVNLLLLARFRDACIDGIEVEVNQILISKPELARRLGFSVAKLRRILAAFEEAGGIRCENIRNKYTRITLLSPFLCGGVDNSGDKENTPPCLIADEEIKTTEEREQQSEEHVIPLKAESEDTDDVFDSKDRGALRAYGRFGNVFLSEREYSELTGLFSEPDTAIEKLSAYLVNFTGPPVTNHFAKLCQKAMYEKEDKAAASSSVKSSYLRGGYMGKGKDSDLQPDPDASYDIKAAEERARHSVPKLIKKRNGENVSVISSSSALRQ